MQKNNMTKHYKKNRLKKRIARLMNLSNTISVIFILVTMIIVIGTLVSLMGKGFSIYTANSMADDIQRIYEQSDLVKDFKEDVEEKISEGDSEFWLDLSKINEQHASDIDFIMFSDMSYFEYRVSYGGRVLYDSFVESHDMDALDKYNNDNIMTRIFFVEKGAPYYNRDGDVIGSVDVRVSPDVINTIYIVSLILTLLIFIVNRIISKIITSITSNVVSKPLENLAQQMEVMAHDNLEGAFNTVIEVKRPVSEVQSLTESTTKIMQKMAHYYELMMAQNEELEAQRDTLEFQKDELEAQRDEVEAQRDELESQKDELELQNNQLALTGGTLQSMNNAYLSRTLKLQNLLDNVGQGFMTFGSSLVINSEYSVACASMLCDTGDDKSHGAGRTHRHDITGEKVIDLLFADDEQKEFIESLFIKIIGGNEHERNLFIPLLPEEIEMGGRVQKVEYKMVQDEQALELMMIILTDITMTRELEKQMLVERDILQMIVKVLLSREDFLTTIEEFRAFLESDFGGFAKSDFEELLRVIHTFKGSFAQYYLNNTSDCLNVLEDEIYKDGTIEAIHNIDMKMINDQLEKDLNIIEGYVGSDFKYKNDLYTVKEEKIIEIEQKLKQILPATEFNKIIPIIKSIRYRSVKEGLKSYPDYVTKLSERMEKSIVPFEIEGDDVFVDFDMYQKVFKSMIHLFRNAVDHGIEDVDSRIEQGKHESAVIRCEVINKGATFDVIIEDDGRGIDPSNVDKIFKQGFTTKESATAISGRGVGLTALKATVKELGGKIVVDSELTKGSKFTLTLPRLQGSDIIQFEPELFIERIEGVASAYFKSMNLEFEHALLEKQDKITLNRVTSLINMKGSIDGMLIVSSNAAFARDLVGAFILGEIEDEAIDSYAEDVLGEVTNTILGNVLGILEEEGIYLSIGVPVMLSNESAYIKYSDRQILSVKYVKGDHVISINLLLTEGGQ